MVNWWVGPNESRDSFNVSSQSSRFGPGGVRRGGAGHVPAPGGDVDLRPFAVLPQAVQQVADVAAREIAHTPLAQAAAANPTALYTLNNVLYGDAVADPNLASVRTRIFDERYLVLTIDPTQSSATELTYNGGHLIGDFPLVTQLLLPVMIYDQINPVGQTNAQPIQLLRYPGAMFQDSSGYQPMPGMPKPSGYLVRIPVVSTPPASTAGTGNSSLYPTAKRRSPAGYGRWNRSSTRPGKTPFR